MGGLLRGLELIRKESSKHRCGRGGRTFDSGAWSHLICLSYGIPIENFAFIEEGD